MKKLLVMVALGLIATGTANAQIDLVSAAQNAQAKIDATDAAVKNTKAAIASSDENAKDTVATAIADKKAEINAAADAKKAEIDAAAAQKKSALENAKNIVIEDKNKINSDLNTIKNSFK